jgi:hypothetical protein
MNQRYDVTHYWCVYIFSLHPFLIRIVGGGVHTGSTRHVGHWIAYCTCPRWLWWGRIFGGIKIDRGKPKYSEKTCPRATLSTTIPTWPDWGSNTDRRGGKPATNRLSYGAACLLSFKQLHPVPEDGDFVTWERGSNKIMEKSVQWESS